MFELTAPRPVHFAGTTESAPLQPARVDELGVIGTLFRGEIRQLHFDHRGALLVLAGRGVLRLDPATFAETGRWLADRDIHAVHPCGERLWVVTGDAIFLAAFGEPLAAPLAAIAQTFNHCSIAAGTRLAVPHDRGVTLLDAADGSAREYLVDPAWLDTVWSKRPPDRALLSDDGRYIGVTTDHGHYVVVWDAATGAVLRAADHTEATALLADGRILHLDGKASTFTIADAKWAQLPPDAHYEDAVVRGERVLVADARGGFSVYEIAAWTRVAELSSYVTGSGRYSGTVCAALSATHVASYAITQGVLRVTAIGGATVESHDWLGGAEELSLGRDGRRVGVFREWGHGRLECVDLDAGRLHELRAHHDDITNCAITGDGTRVVVPVGSILRARTVHVGEFGSPESTASHPIKSCAREIVAYGDAAYAIATYTLRGSGHVGLHQAGTSRALAKIVNGKESPWRIAVGHDGDELIVAWESATIVYDISKRPKPIFTWNAGAGAVALGPRGFSACVLRPDQLHIRTPGRPERTRTLATRGGHTSPRLAFSRDGALLFVGASDGVLEVRRADDGALLRELPLHVHGFAALRRCGEAVWTMGADGLGLVVGLAPAAA